MSDKGQVLQTSHVVICQLNAFRSYFWCVNPTFSSVWAFLSSTQGLSFLDVCAFFCVFSNNVSGTANASYTPCFQGEMCNIRPELLFKMLKMN